MATVFLDMAISLDGFVSGSDGGDAGLHDWYFSPSDADQPMLDDLLHGIGAMILGRRMVGDEGGFETPYKVPHFVLTHRPRSPVDVDGATFTFVTDGVEALLAQARAAAGDKDVCVAGGAETARQFLEAGLLDEIRLHVAPVILGGGLRLFDGVAPVRLEPAQTLASPGATHLRYRVVR